MSPEATPADSIWWAIFLASSPAIPKVWDTWDVSFLTWLTNPTKNLTDFTMAPIINKGSISAAPIPWAATLTPSNAVCILPPKPTVVPDAFAASTNSSAILADASDASSKTVSNPLKPNFPAIFFIPFKPAPVRPIALLISFDLFADFSSESKNSADWAFAFASSLFNSLPFVAPLLIASAILASIKNIALPFFSISFWMLFWAYRPFLAFSLASYRASALFCNPFNPLLASFAKSLPRSSISFPASPNASCKEEAIDLIASSTILAVSIASALISSAVFTLFAI